MKRKPFSAPPCAVTVGEKSYPINTDFRVWIEISEVISDKDISLKDRLCFLLINGYGDSLPDSMEKAVGALLTFMNMGEERSLQKGDRSPVFSFFEDERLIYAAFRQQYGINLFYEELHWWEFISLLSALDENTAFMRAVGYRSVDCGKIKDEGRRRFYRKMKNRYRLKEKIKDSDIAGALLLRQSTEEGGSG